MRHTLLVYSYNVIIAYCVKWLWGRIHNQEVATVYCNSDGQVVYTHVPVTLYW